jgi:hypothetical protein
MTASIKLGRRAGLAALIAGLAFVGRAFAQQPPPGLVPPPGSAPPPRPMGPHPRLAEADRALHRAREELLHAEHDFGGHRTRAVQYVDGALAEIRAAFQQYPR